ncbi:MAG: OFA family MFS transporter [Syntrophales bacterium]|mgnify:CR=1 FL=1|nr:OFA family MFS transporter [Syntrophales bacterium]HOS78234.1 OFA family MFS transporter [Syntrophales bacterium]HPB69911.1 OFA family MFS transporter [Syntrophales bacterium]HQN26663.1 OFA family MFS transporter [Syntrophales bacterium]
MSEKNLESSRWWIAIAAIVMQLSLGTVYAWSVFKKPLMTTHGWGETETQVTFMICIFVIGLSAAFGGTLVDKKGPKFVATIGGILFGVGTLLAGLADQIGSIWLLYLGFGLIAGLGNGFGYVTPIATLIRWFPDKRGLVTGLAVMGFGLGAFFMGKIAPAMVISMGVANTFYIWGLIFLVLVTGAAQAYKNPPQGWLPAGFKPAASSGVTAADSFTFERAAKTPQWWMLWLMLFLNITAGLGLISQLSPLAQDVIKKTLADISAAELALAGGTILAIASIFNGLGRLLWAWISDAIGRKNVFIIMFITQAVLYILLPQIGDKLIFTIIACYLLACYGGGFATMPAFAADSFGPAYIGKVYGMMLTAWGLAGVVGPLVFAQLKGIALYVAAGLLIVGFLLAVAYKKPAVVAKA